MKQKPVMLTTPMPTLEEYGKALGLSKKRQKKLIKLVEKQIIKDVTTKLKEKAS